MLDQLGDLAIQLLAFLLDELQYGQHLNLLSARIIVSVEQRRIVELHPLPIQVQHDVDGLSLGWRRTVARDTSLLAELHVVRHVTDRLLVVRLAANGSQEQRAEHRLRLLLMRKWLWLFEQMTVLCINE